MVKILFSHAKKVINSQLRNQYNGLKFARKKAKKQRRRLWHRYWKYYKWKILRLKEHPQRIARGLAAGVFAGCLPFMGLQFVFSVLIAILIRGNKITALMGTWISNPFTYVPIFLLNFKVGRWILAFFLGEYDWEISFDSEQKFTDLGQEIMMPVLLGSVIVAFCTSILAYQLILFCLRKWKKHKI